jgi:hypothetical protein
MVEIIAEIYKPVLNEFQKLFSKSFKDSCCLIPIITNKKDKNILENPKTIFGSAPGLAFMNIVVIIILVETNNPPNNPFL